MKSQSLRTFIALCICGGAAVGCAQTLTVHTGETININNNYHPLYLDELVMQPNSTLLISSDLPGRLWKIQIRSATFGQDSKIIAAGSNGTSGAPTLGIPAAAAECRGGNGGATGHSGSPGDPGIDIDMLVGIKELDHLIADSSGGRGGNGGLGQTGGKGGNANCGCDGEAGGGGGVGGNGADGGDTGRITIKWYPVVTFATVQEQKRKEVIRTQPKLQAQTAAANENVPPQIVLLDDVPVGLEVKSVAGLGGNPGGPGSGGVSGGAHCCMLWCKGSGGPSRPGSSGRGGLSGHYIPPSIQRINPTALSTAFQ